MIMVQDSTIKNQTVKNEGFDVLKIKYNAESSVIRHLFLKRFTLKFHKNTDEERPENRTLFLINVPPFVNEHHIRFLFEKSCGKITKIFFQQNPSLSSASSVYNQIQKLGQEDTEKVPSVMDLFQHETPILSYKVCYVVFNKPSGLENSLKLTETDSIYCLKPSDTDPESKSPHFFTGIKHWQKQYNDSILPAGDLKKVAETFVETFGQRKQETEQMEIEHAEDLAEPNDQGWVTVNRKLRRNRKALHNDRFHDQKIEEKYQDRQIKRRNEEQQFDQQIEPLIKEAVKKKKTRKSFF